MSETFEKKVFSVKGLPSYVVDLFKENMVITVGQSDQSVSWKSQVSISGLPTQVLLDVTSFCNCDCITCYHQEDLNGYVPPLEDLKKRIKFLKNMGLSLFEVTGGEPFSRSDLHLVLEYIHRHQLHFYVVSNGEYISESSDDLFNILKKGLGVAISLDGVGKAHDLIRRRVGLYDKLIAGLEFLSMRGIPVFLISTLCKESLDSVPKMIEVAKQFNTTIHFRPTIRTGGALINGLESVNLLDYVGDLLNHPNVRNGLLNTKKQFSRSKYYGCGLRKRISVDSQCILYPCVMDRSRKFKDITSYTPEGLVKELTEETEYFLKANNLCLDCKYNKQEIYCGGFCRFSCRYKKGEMII